MCETVSSSLSLLLLSLPFSHYHSTTSFSPFVSHFLIASLPHPLRPPPPPPIPHPQPLRLGRHFLFLLPLFCHLYLTFVFLIFFHFLLFLSLNLFYFSPSQGLTTMQQPLFGSFLVLNFHHHCPRFVTLLSAYNTKCRFISN